MAMGIHYKITNGIQDILENPKKYKIINNKLYYLKQGNWVRVFKHISKKELDEFNKKVSKRAAQVIDKMHKEEL